MQWILQTLLFVKLLSIAFSQSETTPEFDFEEFPVEEIEKKLKNDGSETSNGSGKDEGGAEQYGPETCSEPPLPQHAKISKGNGAPYLIGDTISYSCDFGYSADGASHTSTCTKSAYAYNSKPYWTNTTITCNPRSCGDPGYVPNAHRIGSLFTFPNSIYFECDEGYERRGSSVHYCQVNGKWSGSLPTCEKLECDAPEDPLNGRVIYTSLEYESELQYECNKGFVLKNYEEPRICSENGTWSGDDPICQESQCETPVAPVHGSVKLVGAARRVDSMAIYTCDAGLALIGSGVSKCLEGGQWTFPAPKCVAPCSVPALANGYIGQYEIQGYNRRPEFVRLPPNKSLKNDEELYLRCNDKHEPLGKPASETKISCANGIWKEDPVCKPEKCRSQPFILENARISRVDNEHGGIAVYYCKKHFVKTKQGNVTCVFGQWDGIPPTCSDTRCYLEKLVYDGVISERNVYHNGEILIPTCVKGYIKSETEQSIICNSGKWIVAFPPCMPANCTKIPPSPSLGKIKSYSQEHGSKVIYECPDMNIEPTSEVRCHLGEWVGTPPSCKENHCYYLNLKTNVGIAGPLKDPTQDGEALRVQCLDGYQLTNSKPRCSRGTWTQDNKSPCEESGCPITKIANGVITTIEKKVSYNFWGKREERQERKPVPLNVVATSGSTVYLSCNNGYKFEGRGKVHTIITCKGGSWTPNPVCSNRIVAKEKDTQPRPVADPSKPNPANEATPSTVSVGLVSVTPAYADAVVQPVLENCVCTYQGSEDLVAYVGNETLNAGSTVDAHTIVTFQCKKFGFRELKGDSSVYCADCGRWSSDSLPICLKPVYGDILVIYNPNHLILYPNGVLRTMEGTDILIKCYVAGINAYPIWTSNVGAKNVLISGEETVENGHTLYSSTLKISKASFHNNAPFTCGHANKFKTIRLQIIGRLFLIQSGKILQGGIIKVPKGTDVEVKCHGEKATNYPAWASSVSQDKWYQDKRLTSQNIYRNKLLIKNADLHHNGKYECKLDGFNSKSIEIEVEVQCSKFVANEDFYIYYIKEQTVGGQVLFTCKDERKELVGEEVLTCLSNGQWSNQPPQCISKSGHSCPYFIQMEGQKVEYSNGLAAGSYATFRCASPRVQNGESHLICSQNGQWSGQAPSCTLPEATVCILAEISRLLPANVVADTRNIKADTVPYGTIFRLGCKGNLTPAKQEFAQCGDNGQWQIPQVECVPTTYTCQPIVLKPESTMIVSPLKSSYNFGESVGFYCTPGKILSPQIESVMCVQNGWSPSNIPDCIDAK